MPGSTPSSVSRYRPAILVLTGAAAAYAAWLVYDSFTGSPPEGLRRSNAVRRSNNRARARNRSQSARTAQQLLAETMPLGEFDFFGHIIPLDPRDMMPYQSLLELGRELQPNVTDDIIDSRIDQLYDLYIDRLLGALSQGRTLAEIPSAELDAILSITDAQLPGNHNPTLAQNRSTRIAVLMTSGNGLTEVLQRLRTRTSIVDMQGRPVDDLGSIPPTEVGDWEDEIAGDAEGQTLQRTLYHIAEDRARHEGIVHRGITCNGCETRPIRGIRWHCANCADFDLCSDCHATNSHVKTHIFYEIRVPAPNLSITRQEPLYPGRPHMMSASVDPKLKRRLVNDTRMEAEEIEGLWDQFTCLATTPWSTDPNAVGWALDRRAFNHAFIPRYSTFKSAPNLIYDRVFSYFDTDHNTLIGFEEFVKGIDGLHATDTHVKLRIVFNGYDVDGDGYISRKDVLRIFRAHYAIEREATRNFLAESAEEMSVRGALEIIQSAQPLGSAFTQGAIEPGEPNWLLRGKPSDDEVDTAPVAENRSDTMERGAIIANTHPRRNDQDGQMLVNGALRDRWARRQFYTDEEEGFTRPEGAGDGPTPPLEDERPDGYREEEMEEHEQNEPPTPESDRPRWSRSSSRVRFQDDVDVETRSNASTSSRPIGERWGGYEVPEPEKDLGREVLYQVTQQAFNELLDPLFRISEDDAMKAYAWRDERRRHTNDIDGILENFNAQTDLLGRMLRIGVFTYVNCVMKAFHSRDWAVLEDSQPLTPERVDKLCRDGFNDAETSIFSLTEPWGEDSNQPDVNKLWTMMLYRTQLHHEMTSTVKALLERRGWLSKSDETKEQLRSPLHQGIKSPQLNGHNSPEVGKDPTLPQFRPNSLKDFIIAATLPLESVDYHEEILLSPPGFGPLFVLPRPTSVSSSSDKKSANEVGTAPYTIDEHGITLSRPLSLPDGATHPIMHILYLDESNDIADETRLLSLHPSFDPDAPHQDGTFDQAIIAAAYDEELSAANPHLRLVALAYIESVDRRDNERKGAGKISFEEFEQAAREGRMRFLESWMDWVSF